MFLNKNLELILKFPDNSNKTTINTDGELLQKAFTQQVDNSVKFTKNGSITLGYELKNNNLEIFVFDTGKGIEEKSQEKIFHSFVLSRNTHPITENIMVRASDYPYLKVKYN